MWGKIGGSGFSAGAEQAYFEAFAFLPLDDDFELDLASDFFVSDFFESLVLESAVDFDESELESELFASELDVSDDVDEAPELLPDRLSFL